MNRAAVMTFLLGGIAALAVFALQFAGFFVDGSAWLFDLFMQRGILPPDANVELHPWTQIGIFSAAAFLGAWWGVNVPRVGAKLGTLFGLVALIAFVSPTAALHGILLEPFSGVAAALVAGLAGIAVSRTERSLRRSRLTELYGERMSPAAVARLVARPEAPPMRGAVLDATAVTCRIIDLGAEDGEPRAAVEWLASFRRAAERILMRHGGCLEPAGSDAACAVFGVPDGTGDHAESACRAALDLGKEFSALRSRAAAAGLGTPSLGVGISSGPIAFGAAGSGSAAFSAHGPAIEVTRVLAASARKLKGAILLDAAAQGFAKSAVETRPSRKIELPGQDERVQTFELLGVASGADEEFLGANAEVPIRV